MNSQWRTGWPIIDGGTLIKYKDGRFDILYFKILAFGQPFWYNKAGMRVEDDLIECFYVSPGYYRLYTELGGEHASSSND